MSETKYDFESIAYKYAETVDKKPIRRYYERPHLVSLLPECLSNLKVLDLGCGSGWYSEYLSDKGALVTALDNSDTMITLTKNRVPKVDVVLADLEKPLDVLTDDYFDIIISPLTIHYVKEWTPLFKELSKKLQPDGLFIFSTHNPYTEYELFRLENYFKKVKIVDEWEGVGKVEFYHHTLHELIAALGAARLVMHTLLEPRPLDDMKTVDPQLYTKLMIKPWFLFIKAVKVG